VLLSSRFYLVRGAREAVVLLRHDAPSEWYATRALATRAHYEEMLFALSAIGPDRAPLLGPAFERVSGYREPLLLGEEPDVVGERQVADQCMVFDSHPVISTPGDSGVRGG
jgi:hypothetical protein